MTIGKITTKTAFVLACLLVLVLIGFVIFQSLHTDKPSQSINPDISAGNETTGSAISSGIEIDENYNTQETGFTGKGKELNNSDIMGLEDQLNAVEEELDSAHQHLSDELSRKAESKNFTLKLQREYMEDPSYEKSLRDWIDTEYASFFNELNLSPEDLERFKELLSDFYFFKEKTSLDARIQNPYTKEEKDAIQKSYTDTWNDYDAGFKELLGDNDFKKFQEYQGKSSARTYVNDFMESLSTEDKLTKDRGQDLIEIMYEEEMKVYSEIGYNPRKTIEFPSDMNEAGIQEKIKILGKIYSNSIESAKVILSPSQHEQYENYLKNKQEILEMSLKLLNQ